MFNTEQAHYNVICRVLHRVSNEQWSITKGFRYCIIILHNNTSSNNQSGLTGPRGSTYIDIDMDKHV